MSNKVVRRKGFKTSRKMSLEKKEIIWRSLTPLLIDTLNYFWEYSRKNHFMPSYREAAKHFKVTHTAIEHRMWSLEYLGYIKRGYKTPRVLFFNKNRRYWKPTPKEEITKVQIELGHKSYNQSL